MVRVQNACLGQWLEIKLESQFPLCTSEKRKVDLLSMDHILVHVYPEFTKDIVSPVNMLEIVLHSIKLLKKPRLGVSNDLEEWE